jgi:hypothetical protein
MKTTRLKVATEKRSKEDQTKAHLFVGQFLYHFAEVENNLSRSIMTFFVTNVPFNTDKATKMSIIKQSDPLQSPPL